MVEPLTLDEIPELVQPAVTEHFGKRVVSVEAAKQGGRHQNFHLVMEDGREAYARFQKPGPRVRKDPIFGSKTTIERERFLLGQLEPVDVPTPHVYGLHEILDGRKFLLVQALPGRLVDTVMRERGYSGSDYLTFVKSLGEFVAKLQKKRFSTFGEIHQNDIHDVDGPPGAPTYLSWFFGIIDRNLARMEELEGCLDSVQMDQIRSYFKQAQTELAETTINEPSVWVAYDIHINNFLVDDSCRITGVPDVEFAQVAHPSLETSYLNLQALSYFVDEEWHQRARDTFYEAYTKAGGNYNPNDSENRSLEDLANMNRLYTAVLSYNGDKRPGFEHYAGDFCLALMNSIETGEIDRKGFVEPIRLRNKIPERPLS